MLTGSNAQIVGPTVIQSSSYLRGMFALQAHGVRTSEIPYDANEIQMIAGFGDSYNLY